MLLDEQNSKIKENWDDIYETNESSNLEPPLLH